MLVAKSHGYSPFFLTYKQSPILPSRPLEVDPRHPVTIDSDGNAEAAYAEELVRLFWEIRADATERLMTTDQQMKTYHDEAADLIDFIFEPGDLVVR